MKQKKLSSTLPHMILSLGLVSVIAAALLGGMYMVTKEPIEKIEKQTRLEAIRRVAPSFDNDPEADACRIPVASGDTCTVYPALQDGKLNGAAVACRSMDGFAGEITVMCGLTATGEIKDYQVLSHAETPGLGSKMQLWFRDPQGARSVLGKNPQTTSFYVVKDKDKHGEIDGITAATISSRAFLSAMRDASQAFNEYKLKADSAAGNQSNGSLK